MFTALATRVVLAATLAATVLTCTAQAADFDPQPDPPGTTRAGAPALILPVVAQPPIPILVAQPPIPLHP